MCKRLVSLMSLVLVLNLASDASADLVGHWRFDEGSGNVAHDTSGGGHDGTLNGNPQWRPGHVGGALEFDGNGDYVQIPRVVQDDFTLMAWMKTSTPGLSLGSQGYQGSGLIWSDVGGVANDFILAVLGRKLSFFCGNPDISVNSDRDVVTDDWVHVVATRSAQQQQIGIYINGQPEKTIGHANSGPLNALNTIAIGGNVLDSRYYTGLVDDVQIYNHVLSQAEILSAMEGEPWPYAYNPNPPDGALHADTWVTLSWMPGQLAVSHDVYLGESFDDVNSGAAGTFRSNQTSTYYVAGFPGFAYPNGLVPGTTYYWRIDEVNKANPKSPWKGPVWSFTVPPKKAYNPQPADGAKFLDPAATTLSWTAGFGAKLHTVYFGENRDTVANATGGLPQGITTYKPGALKVETTYYWRVDEFDALATHKGDVWSFTTAKAGGGVKGQYYKGMDFNALVLTRTDPQINFTWGAAAPDPVVGVDQFSVRWTGEVEAAFTETYTFYARADDGVRLWVNGQQLVNAWIDQGATEYSGKVDLVAGNTYSVQMEMYENGGDAVAELRWQSPRTLKQLIPQAALSLPVKAISPSPANGATGTRLTPLLRWRPGDYAVSHEIYFGIEANAVRNAAKTSPEYKGTKALGDEKYDPGKLAWYTTYYWRVDEVNSVHPDSPWVGSLWSFTTGDFLVVDDFEDYDAGDNQIWYSWHDGLGYGAPTAPPYYAGNGTGAAVGDENTASYTEETIVHGGRQSMPVAYDNNKQGFAKYSEVEFKLAAGRDWTEESVAELSLWFRGDSTNMAELLYVAVSNAAGQPAVVVHPDPAAAQITTWTEWVIPLQSLAAQGITLTNVDRIAVGLGTRGNQTTPGGSGKMYFDDIRLYRPRTP